MTFCSFSAGRCERVSMQTAFVAHASKRASDARQRLLKFNSTLASHRSPAKYVDRYRRQLCVCSAQSQSSEVKILELVKGPPGSPVLFFVPGLDGTGMALSPHLDELASHGLSVQSLYIPPSNRQSWDALTATTVPLVRAAAAEAALNPLIFVAESFGTCLALRVLLAAPDAASKLVLINSATSFNLALLGVPGLVADTGFLALFNSPLYSVSKAVFLPFLLDQRQATSSSSHLLDSMFSFTPAEPRPDLSSTPPTPQSTPKTHQQHQQQSSRSSNSSFEWPVSSLTSLIPSDDAACTSFRIRLLRTGAPSESLLRTISVPTLIVSSAQDRLLPSKYEGDRLGRILPHSKCIVLPQSGHAPLLERNVNFLRLLIRARVLSSVPYTNQDSTANGTKEAQSVVEQPTQESTSSTFEAPGKGVNGAPKGNGAAQSNGADSTENGAAKGNGSGPSQKASSSDMASVIEARTAADGSQNAAGARTQNGKVGV